MNLNLRELASGGTPVALHGAIKTDLEYAVNGIRLTEPIVADVVAYAGSGTAVVKGTLSANIRFDCAKCLKPVKERVEYPVMELFTMQRDKVDADEDIHLVHDEIVTLDPYLQDAFLVQLPMAAVCDPSCKGLCPVCGKDWNVENCRCEQENIDPRLEGLKRYFQSQ